jgi:hypothetical protein
MIQTKPIEDWTLRFPKLILRQIPRGFISNIIVGERRTGKSIYILKCFAKVYKQLEGLSDEDCWFKALECFMFGPDELTKKIFYNTTHDIISPCLCIDDATVHFNPMIFFVNPYMYGLLGGIFDTIGTATNCVALTCPKKKRLMTGLKNYDDYTTQIVKSGEGDYERLAKGVYWYTWPDGTAHWRRMFEDHYSCYAPEFIYRPYLEKRKKYLKITNDLFMQLQEKMKMEQKKRFPSLPIVKDEINGLIAETDSELVAVEESKDVNPSIL